VEIRLELFLIGYGIVSMVSIYLLTLTNSEVAAFSLPLSLHTVLYCMYQGGMICLGVGGFAASKRDAHQ
jgi:hypothetical protein